MSQRITTLIILVCLLVGGRTTLSGDERVDFQREIAPILESHCLRCHYDGNAKGDVSLSHSTDLFDQGYVFRGDVEASYLIDLVTGENDEPPAMPKEGEPLSNSDVQLLETWVAQGAEWPDGIKLRERSKADAGWWSLQPLRSFPENQTLDPFIDEKLQARGLRRNPPADRRTLIRRATYDLTGLPPTPAEIEAFLNDSAPDAYEKLIDRLLASPRYGERWGRHWLDVVRFGESNGFERNVIIDDLWPFRDYVINSLNDDKPFDQFIREHLAGDVFGKGVPEVEIGSAFLVAGPYDNVGNQDAVQAAQIRANTIDEMIRASSEAFLGLTMGCARCHDHKFDPLLQRDYYSWYATFSGVRHGSREWASAEDKRRRVEQLKPLNARVAELERRQRELDAEILKRIRAKLPEYEAKWTRPPIDRTGTEEIFEPVVARFVRLISEANDINPNTNRGLRIDEFEVWSRGPESRNVALASNGGQASGASRRIDDFPGAYGPHLAIDGKTGARYIATGNDLTIELAKPTEIHRVVFSSAKGETTPEHGKFSFTADYRIEVSADGEIWTQVADSWDRQPVDIGGRDRHIDRRLRKLETTDEDRRQQTEIAQQLAAARQAVAQVPRLPTAWIGSRDPSDAKGPFQIFLGGSPQRRGDPVVPASLSVIETSHAYQLEETVTEDQRRLALANWIAHPENPLTPRVLANRVWHYHFGTGIVATPSDFGYMGGRPTHPELLDWLATQLIANNWQLKPLHKLIMLSETYQQASTYRPDAAAIDADARLLWRFPMRRLSAEEIRDTMLMISGQLNETRGGPGFRLYEYLQDNVSTYVPLEQHGPETYRRAVYHQNARASVIDLMTDFDQPDCAFSTPRRAETTTPLQALTMLNHTFTLDMANFLAARLQEEAGTDPADQIVLAYRLCYGREPAASEANACLRMIEQHSLAALCRVLLNTSEMIYVE